MNKNYLLHAVNKEIEMNSDLLEERDKLSSVLKVSYRAYDLDDLDDLEARRSASVSVPE